MPCRTGRRIGVYPSEPCPLTAVTSARRFTHAASMAIKLLSVNAAEIRLRLTLADPVSEREYIVDRRNFGSIAAIRARSTDGGTVTIGNFRTRDGSAMQPDYARLRKLLAA